jgi:hypothetical protein
MHRAIVLDCLPWLLALVASVAAAALLLRLSGGRLQLGRLRLLHADNAGSVQSLSFVLTVPVFVLFLMFIVQVSQLMIGTMVVHYAAFAAVRAAIVWIPADFGLYSLEPANCISTFERREPPDANPDAQAVGELYGIRPESLKWQKIQQAAALACMPLAPSRRLNLEAVDAIRLTGAVQSAYEAIAPSSREQRHVRHRLENKLTYSLLNTRVDVSFAHKWDEPPIARYNIGDDLEEFRENEVGWQDPITVRVTHHFALLPGLGRLLGRPVPVGGRASDHQPSTAPANRQTVEPGPTTTRPSGGEATRSVIYTRAIRATATLTNEGEKSVLSYVHLAD